MRNTLNKLKKYLTSTTVAIFLIVGFFLQANVALANLPGYTPSDPVPGNDTCFAAADGNLFSGFLGALAFQSQTYCFPDMTSCLAAQATASIGGLTQKCLADVTKKSGWDLVVNNLETGKEVVPKIPGALLEEAVMAALVGIAFLFFTAAGYFLTGMGSLLDIAISSTINSDFYAGLTVINIGWTAVRDFSNMFFIFALLYIAIKTILGLAGSNTKRWVANLIIAAVLINFSLFATKVVIDAGNVLAHGFWDKMQVKTAGMSAPSATLNLLEGFKLQSIANPVDKAGKPIELTNETKLFVYLGGGIFMFIAGYVFLAGAIMMIVRSVTLIFLMIVSPFAFLGFGLPVAGGFSSKWLSKLIGSAFVAPAFIAMLYIVSTIINSPDLFKLTNAQNLTFGAALAGSVSSYAIIYNYVLLIILVLASLTVANAVSSGAGDKAEGYLKKGLAYGGTAIGGTAAVAGFVGRNTIGRQQRNQLERLQNNKNFQAELRRNDAVGRAAREKLANTERFARATYDVRNIPYLGKGVGFIAGKAGINIGTGSKSNRLADDKREEKDKAVAERAKKLFPGNEAAQARFIKDELGDRYDLVSNKDIKKSAEKQITTAENSEAVKENLAKSKEANENLAKLQKQKEDIEKEGNQASTALVSSINDAAKSVSEANTKLEDSLKRISSNEKAELVEEHADNSAFANSLTRADLNAIQRKALSEKGYKQGTTEKLIKSIAESGNVKNIEYLKSAAGQDTLFELGNIEEQDLTNYNRNKARIDAAKRISTDREAAEKIQNKIRPLESDLKAAQEETAKAQASGLPGRIADAQRAEAGIKDKINKIINA